MQSQISKKETFYQGIDTLLALRKELMKQIVDFKNCLGRQDFNSMPFINEKGYHNKTVAYSLYHTFRIEDIVANSLIKKEKEVFFQKYYQNKMNSLIITTGNELEKAEIAEFSSKLDLEGLYNYIFDVDSSTAQLLKKLSYQDLKIKMTEQDKETLKQLKVVSDNGNAFWLIDYWCCKNIQRLIQMPFSRHWIMHVEAAIRIKNKIIST